MIPDFLALLQWWFVFFLIGIFSYPAASYFFGNFTDKGYIFAKILGIILLSYAVFILAIFNIAPFNLTTLLIVGTLWVLINGYLLYSEKADIKSVPLGLLLLEEVLFISGIIVWSYVRAHEPSINGLEKFMDFGFVNSILRADYFPPTDMWFPPESINYYYYGHYVTALITKLSFLPSNITYNLMLATIFAFAFAETFSIVYQLLSRFGKSLHQISGGLLGAILLTLGGNLHTVYTFFGGYPGEEPQPFWTLPFKPLTFLENAYWYPNATRFIPYTIHEFPIYSFVVADLHGHVLDIPFVLFTIALLYSLFQKKSRHLIHIILLSLMLSVMYMTNAWDGAIYILLSVGVLTAKYFLDMKENKKNKLKANKLITFVDKLIRSGISAIPVIALLIGGFFIFSLPFNLHFKPFVSGVGVLCAPEFLTNIGSFGPFLFEKDHCDLSPFYMLVILYGFFYFFVALFFIFLLRKKLSLKKRENTYVFVLILLSSLLIILPEMIYVKDIYPQHYRANTMFKLTYQSFMMLSIVSAYMIFAIIKPSKNYILYALTIILLIPVLLYPFFAVNSYYAELKNYRGIDGTAYLQERYPEDYKAIQWINENIKNQPVMVEAQGDSYTDYERISANTGLPTVLGWTVHEWLWRGSYEIPAPRINDVARIYESTSIEETRQLLQKYDVEYVYIGGLEREKYPSIQEEKFRSIGQAVYLDGAVVIYKL